LAVEKVLKTKAGFTHIGKGKESGILLAPHSSTATTQEQIKFELLDLTNHKVIGAVVTR
jgi:hypothetical protein